MTLPEAQALKNEGNELFKKGEWLKAAATFTKTLKLLDSAPDDELRATVLSNRSAAFVKLAKARQALADAEQAVALRPTWDKACFRRGIALELLDRPQEAIEAYTRAAELAPDKPGAEVLSRLRALKVGVPKAGSVSSSAFSFKKAAPSACEQESPRTTWLNEGTACETLLNRLIAAFGEDSDAVNELRNPAGIDAPRFASTVAVACLQRKGADESVWQLLAPDGALYAAIKPEHRPVCALTLEAMRAASSPGIKMPLSHDPAALVLAARCLPECGAVRRAAFESCNAAFLAAAHTGAASVDGATLLFDHAVVVRLMKAGLADACLDAVAAPSTPPQVREAAAGTFHNLVHHARRQAQASSGSANAAATARAQEQLAHLLDRPENPLDDPSADEGGDAEAWDAAAAHAFFGPIVSLLSTASHGLLSPLSLQLLRCNALDIAQQVLHQQLEAASSQMLLMGCITLLLLLERVAAQGPADALRPLAQRSVVAEFRQLAEAKAQAFVAMARAMEVDLKVNMTG